MAIEVSDSNSSNPKDENKWVWKHHDAFGNGNTRRKKCGGDTKLCNADAMEQLVTHAGGYVWRMPLPQSLQEVLDMNWFSSEWKHLSADGRRMAAEGVLELLSHHKQDIFAPPYPKQLGSFGAGDQCFNCFQSGDLSNIRYKNGKEFDLLSHITMDFGDPYYKKVTLEIIDPELGGSITFESKFDAPVPVSLSYMSITDPPDYPTVNATLTPSNVDAWKNYQQGVEHSSTIIDPLINWCGKEWAHVTSSAHIGFAYTGENIIQVTTTEHRINPFRVIGFSLCGYCGEPPSKESEPEETT
jgi:hypothetical protein